MACFGGRDSASLPGDGLFLDVRMSSALAAKKSVSEPRPLARWLAGAVMRVARAPLVFALLWPALLAIFGYWAWQSWGARHVGKFIARVETSQIELTPRPDYIPPQVDLTEQVLSTTSLGEMSLLDRQVSVRIAQAYATHAWVERVLSVRVGSGGQIQVQLRYREPVAMVRHMSQHPEVEGWAYYPVDKSGIVLPPDAFTPADARGYLEINIRDVVPRGAPGFSCGDSRVAAAATLAAILKPYREHLGLAAIELHRGNDPQARNLAFDLVTQNGRRVVWGSPPGAEPADEPDTAMKMKLLLQSPSPGTDLRVAALPELRRQQAAAASQ